MCHDIPGRAGARRLYDPSIAASNDLMVSRGRSIRGRVGLERSGSTIRVSVMYIASWWKRSFTNKVSVRILMCNITDRLDGDCLCSITCSYHSLVDSRHDKRPDMATYLAQLR